MTIDKSTWHRPNPKPDRVIKTEVYKYKKPVTGEAEVFRKIWLTRPHVCSNCKVGLGKEAKASYFSHRISKKKAPELRLDPTNIDLLCPQCHYLRDFGTKEQFEKRKVA